MLVAAAVCPHPPLLVPAVCPRASAEVDELREACRGAVRRLAATPADRLVVVGSAPYDKEWDVGAGGTLAGYGVPVAFGGPDHVLPLSLTIGAYLLDTMDAVDAVDAVEAAPARSYVAVAQDCAPDACADRGAALVAGDDRVAVLVMGDGSAKRTDRSPGDLDPRAADFDARVSAALAGASPEALLALDPEEADRLWVAGRPAWQVLAGAARAAYTADPRTRIEAALTYDAAPLGVGYVVAEWRVAATAPVT